MTVSHDFSSYYHDLKIGLKRLLQFEFTTKKVAKNIDFIRRLQSFQLVNRVVIFFQTNLVINSSNLKKLIQIFVTSGSKLFEKCFHNSFSSFIA